MTAVLPRAGMDAVADAATVTPTSPELAAWAAAHLTELWQQTRARAMLAAVRDGRGEVVCGCEPDLLIDGLCCCDQYTAHRLSSAGLIRPVVPGAIGVRVRAVLTAAGRAALGGGLGV